MMKKYNINNNKNIGNVIFVVEGGRPETGGTELRLLKNIFTNILGYEVQELRRGCDEFIGHGSNPFSRVFALNVAKNQLTQLTNDALDKLYERLREEFSLKPENCPIFFLYDRDFLSYARNELRGKYVKKYTDPFGNEFGDQGQLLLSYPSVESYILSCFQDDTYLNECYLGPQAKQILSDKGLSEEDIKNESQIINATVEMDKGLNFLGIEHYDLDDLGPTLLEAYDKQQSRVTEKEKFSLLSLISMALLELGVIVETEDDT